MKAPCETSIWYILPLIRRALARALIEEHGLTQSQAAKRLGLTSAAVSQYVSGKRGGLQVRDARVLKEIKSAAKRIAKADAEADIQEEICRLCKRVSALGLADMATKDARRCPRCP